MDINHIAVTGRQTKEGFIRDSLIQLYSACDAPETIDSVELREVNESTYQFLGCSGEFDVEFTAEIGYDRREQYLDEVREYNANLKKYVSRTVVKERVVTDWRPHSGKFHKSSVSLISTENNDTVDYGDLDPEVASKYGHYKYDKNAVVGYGVVKADEETLSQYAFTEPTQEQMRETLRQAEDAAESQVYSELPGDRKRNFRPETKVTDMEFFVYAVNRFKTAFDFCGKTHYLKQFATEAVPTIYCSAMNSDEEANMLRAAEQKELNSDPIIQANKKYALYGQYAFAGCIVFAILFGIALPMLFNYSGGGLMTILGAAGAVVSYLAGYRRFQKKVDAQTKAIRERFNSEKNDHFQKLQEKKITLLNTRLLMMGQEPLTESELKQFSEENKHQLDANYK